MHKFYVVRVDFDGEFQFRGFAMRSTAVGHAEAKIAAGAEAATIFWIRAESLKGAIAAVEHGMGDELATLGKPETASATHHAVDAAASAASA